MTQQIRLNKFLSDCGIASRRKTEEFIIQGRVSVNGKTVNTLSCVINPTKDKVALDGETIKAKRLLYFLLNKPKGYITSTNDEKGRKTVVELIDTKENIFPIGRLDYNTTGVLLLTNDGDFSNFLAHPKNKIPREYEARINKPLKLEDEAKFLKGFYIDGKKGKFVSIEIQKKDPTLVKVVTVEGRNHFVKKMFAAAGYFVNSLDRTNYGVFSHKKIPVGAYRLVTENEIEEVYKEYAKKN
ncbi:MAG: pseudouridine synthase [Ignavibacteria bacterium]|nr:pseudouridine synthase [Ignavibacteria bacterium]